MTIKQAIEILLNMQNIECEHCPSSKSCDEAGTGLCVHALDLVESKLKTSVGEWVVKDTPTADVVEVKRGEWKDKQQTVRMGDMIITGTYPTCNLCGQAEIGMVKQTNFCPNCGADMRGAPK